MNNAGGDVDQVDDQLRKAVFDDKYALSSEQLLVVLKELEPFPGQLRPVIKYIDGINSSKPDDHRFEIFNTSHSSQPGQHWFAVVDDARGRSFSFDSYGRNLDQILAPQDVDVPKALATLVNASPEQLQNTGTVVCGHYILDFAVQLKRTNGDVEAAWKAMTRVYHPIRQELGPTAEYIQQVTLMNDVHCLHKMLTLFPELAPKGK